MQLVGFQKIKDAMEAQAASNLKLNKERAERRENNDYKTVYKTLDEKIIYSIVNISLHKPPYG